jgi:hypothetical protein
MGREPLLVEGSEMIVGSVGAPAAVRAISIRPLAGVDLYLSGEARNSSTARGKTTSASSPPATTPPSVMACRRW